MAKTRMEDLTDEEFSAIVEGSPAFDRLMDLECAWKGIPLLPEDPGPKPDTVEHVGDVTLYEVGDCYFSDKQAAEAILDLMEKSGPKDRHHKSSEVIVKDLKPNAYNWPKIKQCTCFSEFRFEALEGEIKEAKILMDEWLSLKNSFDAALEGRKEVIDDFRNRRDTIREIRMGVETIQKNFERYIDLAQGQYDVAVSFLTEANKSGLVEADGQELYFCCSNGHKHLAVSRKNYQIEKMEQLLEVKGTKNDTQQSNSDT